MILRLFFVLSPLLFFPAIFCRVQLRAQVDIASKDLLSVVRQSMDVSCTVDTHELVIVDNKSDTKIEFLVLKEEEKTATIGVSVYSKNNNGDYKVVSEPILVLHYEEPGTVSIEGRHKRSFKLVVYAQKM